MRQCNFKQSFPFDYFDKLYLTEGEGSFVPPAQKNF